MPRHKIIGDCKIEGCGKPIDSLGMCINHYHRQYYYGRTHKVYNGNKVKNPFYSLWFERKNNSLLSSEWLDFWQFVKDISPKPEGNYFLVRLDATKPYAIDNFKWQEHLKRKKDESRKDWHARKWAARQAAHPSMEIKRSLKRKYGMTSEQYHEKLRQQNNVCYICKKAETSIDGKTGNLKNLAVDHCHETGKWRDLLCSRCNTTIGKVEESIEILDAMKAYLIKHSSTT